jgi:hypothetical protein
MSDFTKYVDAIARYIYYKVFAEKEKYCALKSPQTIPVDLLPTDLLIETGT